jgi:3-hydroxy acid dehydrogenase/malonic semialdehyde reductase
MKNKKRVLITGASSGIGRACAEALARDGQYDLWLWARRSDRLKEVQSHCLKMNPQIQVALSVCDLKKTEMIEKTIQENPQLVQETGVLINNAGLARGVEMAADANWENWNEMIDVNMKSLFFMTRKILPSMILGNEGHIVNIGSVAGRIVYPGGAVYCATKFAVRAFSDALRLDVMGKGIRVTNIEPGMVNTEFSLVRLQDQAKADAVYNQMTPLSAMDIAETVLWSLKRPKHVNIQEIVVYPTDQAGVGYVHRSNGQKS